MEGKVKLPQDLINCPLSELEAYINAHLPGGHKRRLAEALLASRKAKSPAAQLLPLDVEKALISSSAALTDLDPEAKHHDAVALDNALAFCKTLKRGKKKSA